MGVSRHATVLTITISAARIAATRALADPVAIYLRKRQASKAWGRAMLDIGPCVTVGGRATRPDRGQADRSRTSASSRPA